MKKIVLIIFSILIINSAYGKTKLDSKTKINNFKNNINDIKKEESYPLLIPIKKNGLWGYSDINGNIVIEPKYREVDSFKEGLAVIKDFNEEKGVNKYGVVNIKGDAVIKPEYDYIKGYKNGFTVFKLGEKYGSLNKFGNIVVPILYDELSDFSENLSFFKSEGKYGYISNNGKVKIKPIFDKGFNFNNGIAKVIIGDKVGYINSDGKFIKEIFFNDGREFQDGFASVKENNTYGYINSKLEYIIKSEYENGSDFSEGVAAVKINGKYGFINLKGELVIPCEYDYAFSFKDGIAIVENQKKFSYIGFDGKRIFDLEFDEAFPFSEGVARVKINGKYGFINKTGSKIIENKYNSASDFENGIAKVELDKGLLYVDKSGKEYLFEGYELKSSSIKPIDDLINLKQDALYYTDKKRENSLLVDNYYQNLMNISFNKAYFSPWHSKKSYTEKSEFKWILNNFEANPGFGENKLKHDSNWIKEIRENCEENTFPSMLLKGITVADTSLRLLPTNKPSFDSFDSAGGGYPFDNLQNSAININTPIVIVHKSKDGAWYFVETAFAPGWVSANDIAFVDDKFVTEWETDKLAAVTVDNSSMSDESGIFRFYSNVGAIFPKSGEDNLSYIVKIAIADQNRNGVIKYSKLSKENGVVKPAELTQKNISQIINKVIGKPYGWGGMNEDRDCSATLRDLFAPFGLWLPRNSAEQAKTGIYFSLKNLAPADKEKIIIENGVPYLTIIWIKGHIMLYIGTNNGKAIVFHNTWGIKTKDINGKEGRKIIGGSVITTLEPGKELPESYGTLLNKIEGFTILVPPPYIQKILSNSTLEVNK